MSESFTEELKCPQCGETFTRTNGPNRVPVRVCMKCLYSRNYDPLIRTNAEILRSIEDKLERLLKHFMISDSDLLEDARVEKAELLLSGPDCERSEHAENKETP
jgi:hypothetical protein